ncbi:hypothetical protein LTR95_018451 [Oleoguttula sp. CCFEE 5521]
MELFDSSNASAQVLATIDTTKSASLDSLVPLDVQQIILDRYKFQISRLYPVVPLHPACGLTELKVMSPILLHAIIFASAHGILSIEDFDAVALSFIATIATEVLTAGKKSMELLQALQVACLWYCAPQLHDNITTLIQFTHAAKTIAVNLGCGGELDPPSEYAPSDLVEGSTIPAKRAWLVCFVVETNSLFHSRRPSDQRWTAQHSACLDGLDDSGNAGPVDRLLAHQIRGERLCLSIMQRLALAESIPSATIGEPLTTLTVQDLESKILEWRSGIPTDLMHPNLQTLGYTAEILLHEAVLHTDTNKQSFAVPYLPHRLLIGGFPAPVVNQYNTYSLQALNRACHNAIDSGCSVSKEDFLSLPYFLFAPRIAYAVFILAKIYIAVTAPGNTFGAIMTADEVRLDHYLAVCADFDRRTEYDRSPGAATRILKGVPMLRVWLAQYEQQSALFSETIDNAYDSEALQHPPASGTFSMLPVGSSKSVLETALLTDIDYNWDGFLDLGPNAGDFSLTDFFSFAEMDGSMGNVDGL